MVLLIFPVIAIVSSSLIVDNAADIGNGWGSLTSMAVWRLTWRSFATGVSAVATSLVLGIPFAIMFARIRIPYSGALFALWLAPLCFPPYIFAVGWSSILRPDGSLNELFGVGGKLWDLAQTIGGCGFLLGVNLMPITMTFVYIALRGIPMELEEAVSLEANIIQKWIHLILPLIKSAVVSSGILVFILAIGDVGVPIYLNVQVLTTEIFTQFSAFFNPAAAMGYCLPLIAMTAGLAWWERKSFIFLDTAASGTLSEFRPPRALEYRWVAFTLLIGMFGLLILFPLLGVVEAALKITAWNSFLKAFQLVRASIFTSLFHVSMANITLLSLGIFSGYAIARQRIQFLELTLLLLYAVPGTILGVGMIQIWNRPMFAGIVYNTGLMIYFALLARHWAIAAKMFSVVFRQIPLEVEEAAEVEGAGTIAIWSQILFPLLRPAIGPISALIAILCYSEIAASIVVYPAGQATLPVQFFTVMANAPDSVVAWIGIIIVLPLLVGIAGLLVLRRAK